MFSDSFKILSSLDKVLLNKLPDVKELAELSVLKNERFSFQVTATGISGEDWYRHFKFEIKSELLPYITVRRVGHVPAELPLYPLNEETQKTYDPTKVVSDQPGLYPDPLYPMDEDEIKVYPGKYEILWITVDTKGEVPSGNYRIDVEFTCEAIEQTCTKSLNVEIINADLPEQTLMFTQWFHADCIYSYYNVPAFSEEHWHYLDMFIKTAADNGINMLLTPIFTPPLDTAVGGERPTVQLVDIAYDGKNYSFEFSKLGRWFDMCLKNGIKYFEMAHFFTQWGAKFCPKIMATVNGEYKRIFGWDVSAVSDEYRSFLSQFVPALTAFIEERGLKDVTYFHISDEPSGEAIEGYLEAKKGVEKYLDGYKIIDALSHVEFYNNGVVSMPVAALRTTEDFIKAGVSPLWTYYCCAGYSTLSNRFFAYHGWQTRVMGLQLFKYNVDGFLQWGYNFYYSQFSVKEINPYQVTDAGCAFPSGDAFSVYPGDDCCIESMRLGVFYEGLQDMRALQLLASLIGKDKADALIDEVAGMNVTFREYPLNSEFILALRKRVNELIKENI